MVDRLYPCLKCDAVLHSKKELEDHQATHIAKLPPIKDRGIVPPEKKKQKIELIYKYIGQCPDCGTEVDTIPLEMEKKTKVVMVAWCPSCKKSLEQKEVVKL